MEGKIKTLDSWREIRETEIEKDTSCIEQTVILNLSDFMYMSHPVTFSSSSAFKCYLILLPLRVQEPMWKQKGFLFELSLYNKEGRKNPVFWYDILTADNVLTEYFFIFLNYLRKSHPAAGSSAKCIKGTEDLTCLGKNWQWVRSYYYLVCVWTCSLYISGQPVINYLLQ